MTIVIKAREQNFQTPVFQLISQSKIDIGSSFSVWEKVTWSEKWNTSSAVSSMWKGSNFLINGHHTSKSVSGVFKGLFLDLLSYV